MAIVLKELYDADNIIALKDKINYNFDQIAAAGGGIPGNTGPRGFTGLPGVLGTRGSYWSTGGTGTGTTANRIVLDLNLDTGGTVWQIDLSGDWQSTGVNILGPTGATGLDGSDGILKVYRGTTSFSGLGWSPDPFDNTLSGSVTTPDFFGMDSAGNDKGVGIFVLGHIRDYKNKISKGAPEDAPKLVVLQHNENNGIMLGYGSPSMSVDGTLPDQQWNRMSKIYVGDHINGDINGEYTLNINSGTYSGSDSRRDIHVQTTQGQILLSARTGSASIRLGTDEFGSGVAGSDVYISAGSGSGDVLIDGNVRLISRQHYFGHTPTHGMYIDRWGTTNTIGFGFDDPKSIGDFNGYVNAQYGLLQNAYQTGLLQYRKLEGVASGWSPNTLSGYSSLWAAEDGATASSIIPNIGISIAHDSGNVGIAGVPGPNSSAAQIRIQGNIDMMDDIWFGPTAGQGIHFNQSNGYIGLNTGFTAPPGAPLDIRGIADEDEQDNVTIGTGRREVYDVSGDEAKIMGYIAFNAKYDVGNSRFNLNQHPGSTAGTDHYNYSIMFTDDHGFFHIASGYKLP